MEAEPKITQLSKSPPCCLQFSPLRTDLLLAGTYTLHKETGERTGSVELYRVDGTQLSLIEEVSVKSAILDLKFWSDDKFLTAHSTGEICVWQVSDDEKIVKITEKQAFETDTLITSITVGQEHIGVTTTTGDVATLDRDLERVDTYEGMHSLECWCMNFGESVIYSGGDDSKLNVIDPRIGMAVRSIRHDAGVTAILPWKGHLLSGSYDDHLRKIDISTYRELERHNLGGGVWRLTPHGDEMLVNCMYDGARVVDSELQVQRVLKKNHTSICYGGAWSADGANMATCSFYDNVIQLW